MGNVMTCSLGILLVIKYKNGTGPLLISLPPGGDGLSIEKFVYKATKQICLSIDL